MEAGNRLLLPWRHGVSPAPVGFHHYILSASMAQQRGLEPPSRMNSPTTRFPGGPTTSYRTAADCPAEPFSHCFIAADRTESRNTREHVTDVLWRQEWDSNPQPCSGRRFSGPIGYPLPHPAVWRRGRDSNPQTPFTGVRQISNLLPYHWAHPFI